MKLRQERTILKLVENVSGVTAGKHETKLAEINVPLSDVGEEVVQGSHVAKDEVVEAVEDVGCFPVDLTVYQQDR